MKHLSRSIAPALIIMAITAAECASMDNFVKFVPDHKSSGTRNVKQAKAVNLVNNLLFFLTGVFFAVKDTPV